MKKAPLHLGASTCVLDGYDPSWLSGDKYTSGIYATPEQPLDATAPEPAEKKGEWTYPQITLHDDALSLLDELFPAKTSQLGRDPNYPVFNAGALLTADDQAASLKSLQKLIGVDLIDPDMGYALVKLVREDSEALHAAVVNGVISLISAVKPAPELGVRPGFLADKNKLPHFRGDNDAFNPKLLTTEGVNKYLDLFRKYGTHFISRIVTGDIIFQAFAYKKTDYKTVKTSFDKPGNPYKDEKSIGFAYYTTRKSSGPFGYVAETGNIVSFSKDKAIAKTIEAGDWKENTWNKGDSIFALFEMESAITPAKLETLSGGSVPINYELSTLAAFAEVQRSEAWKRIFTGAIAQRFPQKLKPKLGKFFKADEPGLFGTQAYPTFASALATPTINVYKPRIEMGELSFNAANTIKKFTLSTNLLIATSGDAISLSGDDVCIAAQAVSAESTDALATLSFSGTSRQKQAALYCNMFYGLMRIEQKKENNTYTILDGIKLVTKIPDDLNKENKYVVGEADIRSTVPPKEKVSDMKEALEMNYAFLQSGYNSTVAVENPVLNGFLKNGFEWLLKLVPQDADKRQQAIRLLARDAVLRGDRHIIYVPALKAKKYKAQILDIFRVLDQVQFDQANTKNEIGRRRTEELIIDVANTLNANIMASGNALVTYIDSSAKLQDQMNEYYKTIADKEEAGYKAKQLEINKLKTSLELQRDVVKTAITNYETKVKDWSQMEGFKVAFGIIKNVFSAATGKVEPGEGDFAKLIDIINKVNKIAKVLYSLYEAYDTVKDKVQEMKDAERAMEGVGSAQEIQMSKEDWDEMRISLDELLSKTPDEDSLKEAKAKLLSAYSVLILRGKALLEAQSAAVRMGREVFNTKRLQDISADQAESLKKIKVQFQDVKKFDINTADLIALTGRLELIQSQMLTMLLRSFMMYDQALQYENLQNATPVNDFSIGGFKSAVVTQGHVTQAAEGELSKIVASDTKTIEYLIEGVPVEELTGGNRYRFAITLDKKEFSKYVHVRVKSLIATCETKVSTDTKDVNLKLRFVGDPFLDRDLNRQTREYVASPRECEYIYKWDTMKLHTGESGEGWSDGSGIDVTPFGAWEISFEDTDSNKGIRFAKPVVDLKLSFVLHTRVKEGTVLKKGLLRGGEPQISDAMIVDQVAKLGSVTNRWDVVYNMSLKKINETLEEQYKKFSTGPAFTNNIKGEIRTEGRKKIEITKFDITFSYPQVKFLENNSSQLLLVCKIKGSITLCDKDKSGNKPEECDDPVNFKDEDLTAYIPLSKVSGIVQPQQPGSQVYSVVLDMSKGAFEAANMKFSDEQAEEFNKIVKAHFIKNPVKFIINSLDLSKISTLDDLRPNDFVFKTLITHGKMPVLQLFIQTGDRKAFDQSLASLKIDEPIPAGSSASLFINSSLFFSKIMPASLSGGWQLTGKPPQDDKVPQAWWADFTAGSLRGVVDTSRLEKPFHSPNQWGYTHVDTSVYMNEDGSKTISWPVSGMKIIPLANGTMKLSFKEKRTIPIIKKEVTTIKSYGFDPAVETKFTRSSSEVGVDIDSNIPVNIVSNSNLKEQSIEIKLKDQSIAITGHMEGGGIFNCDDLQALLNQAIRDQMPKQITGMLNVSFSPVSVFALKNLLFPGDNVITLKSAYVPGDMVIFGEFVK